VRVLVMSGRTMCSNEEKLAVGVSLFIRFRFGGKERRTCHIYASTVGLTAQTFVSLQKN
jgi:hypothetical protein